LIDALSCSVNFSFPHLNRSPLLWTWFSGLLDFEDFSALHPDVLDQLLTEDGFKFLQLGRPGRRFVAVLRELHLSGEKVTPFAATDMSDHGHLSIK
jgi:hypothetical protein